MKVSDNFNGNLQLFIKIKIKNCLNIGKINAIRFVLDRKIGTFQIVFKF